MAVFTEVLTDFEHFSPDAVTVGAQNIDELRYAATIYTDELRSRLDIGLGFVQSVIDLSGHTCPETFVEERLIDAIRESLPPTFERGSVIKAGLLAITDPGAWGRTLKESRTRAIANDHTDFTVSEFQGRVHLRKRPKPRLLFVFGEDDLPEEEGTTVLEGNISSEEAHKVWFKHRLDPDDPEGIIYDDCGYLGTLVGSDNTLARGPVRGADVPELGGSFSRRNLPTDTWNEVGPTTVHAMPPEVSRGRICLTLSQRG